MFGLLGELDQAFEWIEKAFQYQDEYLMRIAAESPLDSPIRDDPRWLPFLERIGMAPAQLAAIDFSVDLPE